MKKNTLFALLVCLALSACGNDSANTPKSGAEETGARCYATINVPLEGQPKIFVYSDTPDPFIPAGYAIQSGKDNISYSMENRRVLDDHEDCARVYAFLTLSDYYRAGETYYHYGYYYLQIYPDALPGSSEVEVGVSYDAGSLTDNFLFAGVDPTLTHFHLPGDTITPTRVMTDFVGAMDDFALTCDLPFQITPTSLDPYMIEVIPPAVGGQCQFKAQLNIPRDDPTSLIPPVITDSTIPVSIAVNLQRVANNGTGSDTTQWQMRIENIVILTE